MPLNHELLKRLLGEKGLRLCEFARACGRMSPSSLSAVVSGWQPVGEKTRERLLKGMETSGFTRREISQVLGKQTA